MIEPFTHRGTWHLPTTPDHRVTGTLSFVLSDELRLDLDGLLEGNALRGGLPDPQPLILGTTVTGEPVTLYRCFSVGLQLGSSRLPGSSYIANAAFVGIHFGAPDEMLFDRMSMATTHLDAWAGDSEFSIAYEPGDRTTTITYRLPTAIRLYEDDRLTVALAFRQHGPTRHRAQSEAGIRQAAYFQLRPKAPMPFEEGFTLLARLGRLVTLASYFAHARRVGFREGHTLVV